jgi:hypothetical protein
MIPKVRVLVLFAFNLMVFSASARLVRVYKDCEATASNKSVDTDYNCNIEFGSGFDAFMNVEATLNRPIYEAMVSVRLVFLAIQEKHLIFNKVNYEVKHRVTRNKFRSVVKFDDIKICEYLNGTNINPIVIGLIGRLAKAFRSGLHPCPYVVS